MKELSAAARLSVAKVIKEASMKAAAADMAVGSYDVDVTVNIKGEITVGAPYKSQIVQKAKPWNLVAVALSELNKNLEAAGLAGINMEKLVDMAEKVDPAIVDKAEEEAAAAIAKTKAKTETTCNGKVTTKLEVDVIEEKVSKK